MLLVTPCTDWYLVFTGLARGHLGIAAAVLPINFILQLLLLPAYIVLLGGAAIHIDTATLAEAIGLVLLAPLAAATLLRWAGGRVRGPQWREDVMVPAAGRAVAPLLYLAVFAMFAWQGHLAIDHAAELAALLLPLAIFFTVNPLLATLVSRMLGFRHDQRVTLTMVTVARNSPIALALAAAAFPGRPLIAVSLVIAPLIELPILALISHLVRSPASSPHGLDGQARRD
jgi:ACR3 family arsenite efflux pump ArsB